ncbi:MAG: S8 family serine peptidase, partial [Defluviitaleaceae bacterium]|nr:S8 family serine peptidase [Defluviitaleaceae bacterium]
TDGVVPRDRDHGTQVAGVIGATANNGIGIAGVLWDVDLYGANIRTAAGAHANTNPIFSLFSDKRALAWSFSRGANIVNISRGRTTLFGGQPYTFSSPDQIPFLVEEGLAWGTFLQQYYNAGIDFLITIAAGNDSRDGHRVCAANNGWLNFIPESFPDVIDRIIIVGAIEMTTSHELRRVYGTRGDTRDSSVPTSAPRDNPDSYRIWVASNLGNRVEILAPGVDILTTRVSVSGNLQIHDFVIQNGTSFAAPHVAGVAGMVWSVNPGLTGAEVKDIIIQSAADFMNLTYDGAIHYSADTNIRSSYPVLNAYYAVRSALDAGGTVTQPDRHIAVFGRAVHRLPYPYPHVGFRNFGIGNVAVSVYYADTGERVDIGVEYLVTQAQVPHLASDNIGQFFVLLEPGRYELRFHRAGYAVESIPLNVGSHPIEIRDALFILPHPPNPSVVLMDDDNEYGNLIAAPYPDNPFRLGVGVRSLAEATGFTVDWNDITQEIRIYGDNRVVILWADSEYYQVWTPSSGAYSPLRPLNATPFTHNGRVHLQLESIRTILQLNNWTWDFGYSTEGGHYIFNFAG